MNDLDRKQEQAWLALVLQEANTQYGEATERDDALKDDAVETQRDLWEDLGSIASSDGLDKLVDFLEYINVMKKQRRRRRNLRRFSVRRISGGSTSAACNRPRQSPTISEPSA
jgi:DNA helicase-2/ATP-dependent DNA helicase PcrA